VILVGLGANLPHPTYGPPAATLQAALARFSAENLEVAACSRFFESAPVPVSDQPWFVNAVARVETPLDPAGVLAALHRIETAFGRIRQERWEARILDLDLLDYGGQVLSGPPPAPEIPHPRLETRAFVLLPLADIAPDWVHPVTQKPLAALTAALDPAQIIRPLETTPMP
jgi:2-amino-4-hydroxy-6-hydroxymethyldihydropteridine diphosphokinase